ncbi:emp24p/erv25p- protein [Orbilia oligospora]|uniref:Emp24p/erv25p-protein n=1 Tax=Orbilia oligospora TaxID=2813651 RepID=A0A7C8JKF3_ORBOL|nr:emp24p/erv25p- protein [Orbilia oligospora]KAF3081207.1 emp24p/erv25p- protein [Orbilia oligospora]KAF3088988.1 emp24p/erv25p- protein [Orbilia oligospora]KAF3121945.1 emp24p/erv25p- protein [Orbilia oligospora]KAF3123885.1 emp24p/erv25p- protein [Orbilia oligospora]
MRSSAFISALLASWVVPSSALYFYLDGSNPKCFFEELPKDTLVVGHYKAEEYKGDGSGYQPSHGVNIHISVEETFDHNHRVINQKGSGSGRFTFTAADSGEHRICFTASANGANPGWFSTGDHLGGTKLHLDLAIGETSEIESRDKDKINDIVQRVKDLNSRLGDIRREQVFQREREAEFRDQSELVNANIVKYCILQLAILGATCAWQLSHLRAFFIKQKLT